MSRLKTFYQYLLPQHLLSRLIGKAASLIHPVWLKNNIIKWFIKRYNVDLSEAVEKDYTQFPSFNAFFTRHLISSARPIDTSEFSIVSPADGAISEIGPIHQGKIIQAKGFDYSVLALIGGDAQLAEMFNQGAFATVYLSPRDYHRVHMPCTGKLIKMIHVPGQLFSVNTATAQSVPNLFARNERVVTLFETTQGKMAVILVGAMIVASIATSFAGIVTPPTSKKIREWTYDSIPFEKGQELGYFLLGSTAIVLFESPNVSWEVSLSAGSAVKMGASIGQFNHLV